MPTTVDGDGEADARGGFARREVFAHDDGVGRHDAALEQAEQDRGEIERGEAVGDQVDDQRHALQGRAQQQRGDAAHPVGDPARADAAHDAEAQHQRQHLRAARHAVAEVGAVGDDMDLRHRHGDAAGDAGHGQQRLQGVGRQAERGLRAARDRGDLAFPRGPAAGAAASAPAGSSSTRQKAAADEVGRAPADGRGSSARRWAARWRRRCSCPRRRWRRRRRGASRTSARCRRPAARRWRRALKPIRIWAAANSTSEEGERRQRKARREPDGAQDRGDDDAAPVDQPAGQRRRRRRSPACSWCRRRRCRRG